MNTVEQTIMPFCENWYRYLKRKSDAEMLAFFKTYLKMCFEDYEPTEDDGEAYDYYWIMKPIVETRIRKIAYGKAGGRPKKDIEKDTEKVEKDTEKDKTPPLEKKRNEMKGKEGKENISTALKRERESPFLPDEKVLAASPSEQNPNCPPTLQDLKIVQRSFNATTKSMQISDADIEYFHSEMSKRNWEWIDYSTGRVIHIRRMGVKKWILQFLRGEEKKSSAARVAAEAASAAEATPVTGAGRCAVPIATTEIV